MGNTINIFKNIISHSLVLMGYLLITLFILGATNLILQIFNRYVMKISYDIPDFKGGRGTPRINYLLKNNNYTHSQRRWLKFHYFHTLVLEYIEMIFIIPIILIVVYSIFFQSCSHQ